MFLNVLVCACVHVYMHMTEVRSWFLSCLLSTLFFEMTFLTQPGAHQFDQICQAIEFTNLPDTPVFPSPSWGSNACHFCALFSHGCWRLSSVFMLAQQAFTDSAVSSPSNFTFCLRQFALCISHTNVLPL